MKSLRKFVAGALTLGLLSFGPAAMADNAPPPNNAPVQPSETKPFGDWTVRCYPVKSPSPCDMFELLANKQTQQRVLSVSIAYVPARDAHVIQTAVPITMDDILVRVKHTGDNAALITDDQPASPARSAPVKACWARCSWMRLSPAM